MRILWRALAIVSFTLLFVLVRIGATEHSAQFSAGPHKHDGKICALSLVANNDDEHVIIPSDPPASALITRYHIAFSYVDAAIQKPAAQPYTKATARSPPTL